MKTSRPEKICFLIFEVFMMATIVANLQPKCYTCEFEQNKGETKGCDCRLNLNTINCALNATGYQPPFEFFPGVNKRSGGARQLEPNATTDEDDGHRYCRIAIFQDDPNEPVTFYRNVRNRAGRLPPNYNKSVCIPAKSSEIRNGLECYCLEDWCNGIPLKYPNFTADYTTTTRLPKKTTLRASTAPPETTSTTDDTTMPNTVNPNVPAPAGELSTSCVIKIAKIILGLGISLNLVF